MTENQLELFASGEDTKRCTQCGEVRTLGEFNTDKSRKDGLQVHCKVCRKTYRQENKERIAEYGKDYYQANKERISERDKAYYQANKEARAERVAKRRANKRKNTPKFLRKCPVDKERRVFAYRMSKLLTETTGVVHHVDHMWPISDGGPHWSGNLQVIPAVDNLSKNATVDEEIKKTIQEGLEYARQCYKRR